ncbi:N-acetylglucosamine-6-phosphate deacetylase [Rossellomorea sp. NPDC077527]|uniref:N-acetylglucosamine-6-phosphate deacetylase n=1 Tax=Rossellomorea sp. NPDC077527 TaxID=3364510 RepID=UPI0037CB5A79
MFFIRGDMITGGKRYSDKVIGISNGRISSVEDELPIAGDVHQVNGVICPGFVDIHIHGLSGYDFMDGAEAFGEIAERLPGFGVTSFLATSRTCETPDLLNFLQHAHDFRKQHSASARMLGAHIEGPWISGAFPGAQNKAYIRKFSKEDMTDIISPFSELISIITLAPEEIRNLSLLKELSDRGIRLSAGHTQASIEEIDSAVQHGLSQVTHTFNAMSPVHHRNPGTAAAALLYDELACEIITDGLHVHPRMIELLYKVKGKERMMLVSDCTGYNDLENGKYVLRGKELVKSGDKVTLKNGALAGSAITLDKGIKYAVENCGMPLEDAVYMASEGPLHAIGKDKRKGRIEPGYDADLVVLENDLSVAATFLNGELCEPRGQVPWLRTR